MKKFSVLLALVLLVSVVAVACAQDTQMVVAWWGNQVRNERTQAMLDLYSEQHAGITFDAQFNAWADYWDKLATAAAGQNLPDVIQMDYAYLQQYVSSNLLLDLNPYIESGALDVSAFNEGILNSGKVDGGTYAICIGMNAPALVYNKTLLDSAGLTVKDNQTIEEFAALAKEVYEKTGYKTDFGYNSENLMEYFLRGWDATIYTADGKIAATPEDVEKYFAILENGYKEGWILGSEVYAETVLGSVEQNPMVYGSSPETMSWCAFYWSNQVEAFSGIAPDIEFGVSTWPSADAKKSNYLKPGQFFSVAATSKNADIAADIVNFVTNSVEANDILLGERGIPASSVVADAIAPKLSASNQKVVEYINNVVSPNCSTVPMSQPAGAAEVYALEKELEEAILYGELDAKTAAEQFVSGATDIMNSK